MFPSPILLVAAFSGLLRTSLAAPAESEQCLVGSYVVFEVQPYEVVCGGVTSTSTVTKTYTLPFDPTATDGNTPGKPGSPGNPDTPGSPPSPGLVTVTKPCGGENCTPGTYSPEPGCTKCVVTVVTRTTVIESTITPGVTPDVTPTITIGCPDPDNCKATTLYPPPGCTKTCTVTIITPPPDSGTGTPTITTTSTDIPSAPPITTITTTIGCPDEDNCSPGTYPPSSGCTRICTATVITPPASSSPNTSAPPSTVTTTILCPDLNNCTPGTYPPSSGCTGVCTATVITPPATSSASSSAPPVTTTTTTRGCLDDEASCAPGTYPPTSGCTGVCTATVITPPVSSSAITTEPPSTVTTTVPCPDVDNCTPGTFPPASDCTTGTCTVTVVPSPSASSSSVSSTSEQPSSTSEIPSSTSSETSSSATSSTPPGPIFSCDAGGYLIQSRTLYRLNLTTGENEPVSSSVGPGSQVNAIGYNTKDDYIWGITGNSSFNQLIRINARGDYAVFDIDLPQDVYYNVGDFDRDGNLWILSADGKQWARIDATYGSPTEGQVLESGTVTTPMNVVSDWALVPGGGNYFYAIARPVGDNTKAVLQRWSLDTKQWEVVEDLGNVAGGNVFGAIYSAGPGLLYASENESGEIWRFNVLTGERSLVTQGPTTEYNDGARCIEASDLAGTDE